LVGHVQLNLKGFFSGCGFAGLATGSPFDGLAWELSLATEDLSGSGLISVEPFDVAGECLT
jgi:hypothetical protein